MSCRGANGEFMIGATMIESADKGAVSVRSAHRAARRGLRAASSVRRSRDSRDERRRAARLSRQRAAHRRARTGEFSSTASTATGSCLRRLSRSGRRRWRSRAGEEAREAARRRMRIVVNGETREIAAANARRGAGGARLSPRRRSRPRSTASSCPARARAATPLQEGDRRVEIRRAAARAGESDGLSLRRSHLAAEGNR